jgi:hypothetical protein
VLGDRPKLRRISLKCRIFASESTTIKGRVTGWLGQEGSNFEAPSFIGFQLRKCSNKIALVSLDFRAKQSVAVQVGGGPRLFQT